MDRIGGEAAGNVKSTDGIADRQQPRVLLQLLDCRPALPDDVPQMSDAGDSEPGCERPNEPPHCQAVGVDNLRSKVAENRSQLCGSSIGGFGRT